MTTFMSRPFGGPAPMLSQVAPFLFDNRNPEPAKQSAAPLASQSQALVPNAYDIYAKRKARRVEAQQEDYGDPGPVRDVISNAHSHAAVTAAAMPRAKPVANTSQTSLPNHSEIYAKRKTRRVEVQHEDYGDPGPVRNIIANAHSNAAVYALRKLRRTEWTDNQIEFA